MYSCRLQRVQVLSEVLKVVFHFSVRFGRNPVAGKFKWMPGTVSIFVSELVRYAEVSNKAVIRVCEIWSGPCDWHKVEALGEYG